MKLLAALFIPDFFTKIVFLAQRSLKLIFREYNFAKPVLESEQTEIPRVMAVAIASILNLAGPDMMVVLLIVLLLFGAKRLPELARGMGRAIKEFNAARDEIEKGISQSGPTVATRRVFDKNGGDTGRS
jgi:sec-independent protein translocase protein TatA